MITLSIETYCQNCPEFEARQDTFLKHADELKLADTTISCVHSERCEIVFKHIKRELENRSVKS